MTAVLKIKNDGLLEIQLDFELMISIRWLILKTFLIIENERIFDLIDKLNNLVSGVDINVNWISSCSKLELVFMSKGLGNFELNIDVCDSVTDDSTVSLDLETDHISIQEFSDSLSRFLIK